MGVATGARNLYQIRLVVETCPKQRFEIWEVTWGDGMKGAWRNLVPEFPHGTNQ